MMMASSYDAGPKVYGGDVRELFRNPLAFAGATLGTGMTLGLLAFFALQERPTAVSEDDAFEIDFEPGALVKLGVELDDADLPQKEVLIDTRAPDAAVPEHAVTDDDQTAPAPEPPEDPPTEDPDDRPRPRPRPEDRDRPISKLPTDRTPFDDPPTRTLPKGDPFGDADGWSDLAKDGDPWATAVMAALNGMPVGAFGAKMDDGTAKFQITLCKDGSVKAVQKRGGTLDALDQARVANAVRSLELPEPPATVARQMKNRCAKIRYTFVWSNGKVR